MGIVLRWSAVFTAVVLSAALVSVPASQAQVAALPGPALAWTACTDPDLAYLDLQCASLAVPLDHARPAGPRIRLALTRKPHTSRTYNGVLLTNPGGPGGSGLTMPALSEAVPGGVGSTYDWIGFDPRGVGASSPALGCARGHFGYDRPSYVPRKRWITRYWLRKTSSYAASCADTAAKRALLPHLTTMDTVKDMEAIRQALGAQKISYYGFSYGTYLGQVYATRYPSRVGRFVLDSVVNPTRTWYAANLDQDRAFEANLDVYWRYLAAHPRTFRLGKRWRVIKRGYHRTLRRLDRAPAAGKRLGPAELSDTMLLAGYYVHDWEGIGLDYSALIRKRRGGGLLTRYREAQAGGDNGYAVYNATECTDMAWPTAARTLKDARAMHRRAPFLTWGNTWYNAPCLSWRAPARVRPAISGKGVTAKILLVSETRDAATPYAGALAARRLFPSASLVAGVGGTSHASSLSGVRCVDNAVANYLRAGIVPARLPGTRADRACPRLLPPASFTTWRAPTPAASDPMPALLRRDLATAQRHALR